MNQENQNVEHKRVWKDEYLKWVSGFANAQGGVTAVIYREVFMSVRDGELPVQNQIHCNLPESQRPEVEAFVDRFLLGKEADTNIMRADMFEDVDVARWLW